MRDCIEDSFVWRQKEREVSKQRTDTTVTFRRRFRLGLLDLPAGSYRLVIEADEISGLSFPAHRRAAATLHVPCASVADRSEQAVSIALEELEAALAADRGDLPSG
jgi:hypothetical protein